MARNEKPCLATVSFAALTDWLDGWLARRFGQVSEFGKFMDALADKVLTMGIFVSLLALGALEKWTLFLILLILSREFLITGLRLVAAAKGKTLAAEKMGKVKTVVQLLCISLFWLSLHFKLMVQKFSLQRMIFTVMQSNSSKYLGKSALLLLHS